ncbi:hypothetical protein AVEN_94800-1 [Araneus ventricosus]|uniref:Uncharacterized protein n=1 Tax=Araneus ventricosus TaxID=182803 RepID=A0A4Y2CQD8_ARAVE|nr:hypothetical protein AVEN_94800-1 [Araneus ventricosus]
MMQVSAEATGCSGNMLLLLYSMTNEYLVVESASLYTIVVPLVSLIVVLVSSLMHKHIQFVPEKSLCRSSYRQRFDEFVLMQKVQGLKKGSVSHTFTATLTLKG